MSVIGKYSISDLEVLTGIKAATIRMWEKRYQIISPLRTDTNIRYYTNDHLKELLNINVLNRSGIKISHVAKLTSKEIAAKVKELGFVKVAEQDLLDTFFLSMLELDELMFNQAYHKAVTRLGFDDTFRKIIFPFLKKIGLMWQTGTINPAQEHFISNIVRQKLLAAIDSLALADRSDVETVLLFLPENELHEIGLLFLNYLLRQKGYKTIYLGQALPITDLVRVLEITSPTILVLSISNTMSADHAQRLINQFPALSNHQKVLISSSSLSDFALDASPNFLIFKDLEQLYSFF